MLSKSRLISALLAVGAVVPTTLAWGAAGHEIVATIAQIHLHPSTVAALCDVLPASAKCHLAPVAAWADAVRFRMRWSAPLHYVNSHGDHPSDHCVFGAEGWDGPAGMNVLSAVRNTTLWLDHGYEGAEEALKFLVHFMGDLHQPLHLTGRDKGGNGDKVRFDGRVTNLHAVWDGKLIAKSLRTLPLNYTRPLPSRRIEGALRGAIYDPYVRQIMYEGVLGRFKTDIPEWTRCPAPAPQLSRPYPLQLQELRLTSPLSPPAHLPPTDDEIICPYAWAAPLHELNCDIVWPPELDAPSNATSPSSLDSSDPSDLAATQYLELDTPEYSGRIKAEFITERLLAMAGIRLAATLNYLFAADGVARGYELELGSLMDAE